MKVVKIITHVQPEMLSLRSKKENGKILHSYEMTFWLDGRFSALIRVKNTHELTLSAFPPRQTRPSLKIVQKSFSEKLSLYLFLDFRKIIFESNVFVDWVNNLFLVCVCVHTVLSFFRSNKKVPPDYSDFGLK